MKTVKLTDLTLCLSHTGFREKIEMMKELDRLGTDYIELPCAANSKADILLLHTAAPLLKHSTLCCVCERSEAGIDAACEAIRPAAGAQLVLPFPTSAVQMEYLGGCRPKALLEKIPVLIAYAAARCPSVEFVAEDATRSETQTLIGALRSAIEAGATAVTLCDTAGILLPEEYTAFLTDLTQKLPELKTVTLGVVCSDNMHMGAACMVAAAKAGASVLKTAIGCAGVPSVNAFADVLKLRGDSLSLSAALKLSVLEQASARISAFVIEKKSDKSPFTAGVRQTLPDDFRLQSGDTRDTVRACVKKLGYELSEDELTRVFESFCRVSRKKPIGAKELDAIIASISLDAAPTYKLRSYVANSSNVMSATAQIELEKNGEILQGISLGDGPIDAAFLAIEGIVGHHFELDDFQLQSVTEGREAMGEALVKLRADGKLYSGRGISTDIIGASVRAYIHALNKICSEEERA